MNKQGFTLVEIMIVVLIIGLLAAIAIPNFMRARETTRTNACINNLRQIEGAKEQWAMQTNQGADATPTEGFLAPAYIKKFPFCPAKGETGTPYVIGDMSTTPTCDYSAEHALPLGS